MTVTVDQAPSTPTLSAGSLTFSVGTTGSATFSSTGFPAPTLAESGALPSGLHFTAGARTISGKPTGTAGIHQVTITATNSVGTAAHATFTLVVDQAPSTPTLSAGSLTFTVGVAGSVTFSSTGYPAPTLAESGALPSGLHFTAGAGTISGSPAATTTGTHQVTITATNSVGTAAHATFTLVVDTGPSAPMVTTPAKLTFTVGVTSSATFSSVASPAATFSYTGTLPAGLSLTPTTGVLSGAPLTGSIGRYQVTVIAHSHGQEATSTFVVSVDQPPSAPSLSAGSLTFTVGVTGSATFSSTGFPTPTYSLSKGSLPSDLTLTGTTGTISGTPAPGTGGPTRSASRRPTGSHRRRRPQ